MTIGGTIRYLRKQVGLTQEQLARKVGLQAITIRKYEAGQRKPKSSQIEKLASALNVNVHVLKDMDFRFETVDDIMGIINLLYYKSFITLVGDRNEDNTLKADTLRMHFSLEHPLINMIKVYIHGHEVLNLSEIEFAFDNEAVMSELIKTL